MTVAFIDDHRTIFGVEPSCRVLPIAPSTYFRRKAEERDPTRRSPRELRDEVLRAITRRIWEENHRVYGPRKVWKQMGREGLREARCRVRRLMREMGLVRCGPRPRVDHRHAPESAVGVGFHLRGHLARLRLCGVRHRRLRLPHRRLAGLLVFGD